MTTLLDQNPRDAIPDQVASLLVKDVQQQFPTWSVNFCQRGVSQIDPPAGAESDQCTFFVRATRAGGRMRRSTREHAR